MNIPTAAQQDLQAIHRLVRQGRISESFNALAQYFQKGGPTTPERQRLFTKAFANDTRPDHVALQFAAALLADGDVEGAALLFKFARPSLVAGANLFPLGVTGDMPAYCIAQNYPAAFIPQYSLRRFVDSPDTKKTAEAYICGLPGGRVVGESFLPCSAAGHLFVERMAFNHNRHFDYAVGDRVDGIAVPARSQFLVRTSRASTHGPAILLGHSGNFGHWFLNHVSRLALVEAVPDIAHLPVIIGSSASSFHIETLALMGIGEDRIIRIQPGEFAQFETLWVPSQLFCQLANTVSVQWSPQIALYVRRALGIPDRPVGHRKLFMSRGSASLRRFVNEAEVFAALQPMGFELVEGHALTMAEQIELAGQAQIVVGAVGAAMFLTWFAPRDIPVVDFAYAGLHVQTQRMISLTLGQKHRQVTATVTRERGTVMQHDFAVNPAEALKAVRDALA